MSARGKKISALALVRAGRRPPVWRKIIPFPPLCNVFRVVFSMYRLHLPPAHPLIARSSPSGFAVLCFGRFARARPHCGKYYFPAPVPIVLLVVVVVVVVSRSPHIRPTSTQPHGTAPHTQIGGVRGAAGGLVDAVPVPAHAEPDGAAARDGGQIAAIRNVCQRFKWQFNYSR